MKIDKENLKHNMQSARERDDLCDDRTLNFPNVSTRGLYNYLLTKRREEVQGVADEQAIPWTMQLQHADSLGGTGQNVSGENPSMTIIRSLTLPPEVVRSSHFYPVPPDLYGTRQVMCRLIAKLPLMSLCSDRGAHT